MKTPIITKAGNAHLNRINHALKVMPVDVAHIVKADIDNRITDWLLHGGELSDTYIQNQVRYAESVATKYGNH